MQVSKLDSVLKLENPPDARKYCACLKVQHVTLLPKPNPISFELEGILILMAVFFDAITPPWPSYQIRFSSPETNILAEAQDALKNAFLFSGIVPNMECHTP